MNSRHAPPDGQYVLCVSLDESDALVIYDIDAETGLLTRKDEVRVGSRPGAQTMHPTRPFLYVSIRDEQAVGALTVDSEARSVRLLGKAPLVSDAVYMTTDRAGNYLITSFLIAGQAAIYPIKPEGLISTPATQIVSVGSKNPHSIQADPSNRFVYVPAIPIR
jgi:6-phosphogluconolactonase (cycloisomerase 2 family)